MNNNDIFLPIVNGERGIYILSRPVHSGKTTLLMNWVAQTKNVGGILCPDINGLRKLYDISSKKMYDFQLKLSDTSGSITQICNYSFDDNIFKIARELLMDSVKMSFDYVIVDEIGKLELHKKSGLEPAVSAIIHHYNVKTNKGKLLLVIRDYLLEESIKHYKLEEAVLL
jgi:nucleoside-triphosphatase THEP1